MKRICIVCPSAYPHLANEDLATDGGAELQLKTIGRAFSRLRYDVHFIVDDFDQPKNIVVDGINIHKVAFKYRGGHNYYLPVVWLNFLQTLYVINADIHLIKFPRDLLLPLGIYRKFKNKKLIFIGQIDTDVNPKLLKKTENLFSYWFYRAGLPWVDYIIAQNKKQQKGFERVYGKEARVIKSIITLPRKETIAKKGYVLWVGNNLPKKQPDKFLELARMLPQFQFKMIMAPTSKHPDVNFVKNKLNRISNLEYLGYVPFSKIAEYFQCAELFVSTSLREGFPNTFLQAWQYRTPVVSLNVDLDGNIEKYEIGRLSRSFEKLCKDVKTLMENKKLREKMGKNGQKYVDDHHSAESVISQYIEVLESFSTKV